MIFGGRAASICRRRIDRTAAILHKGLLEVHPQLAGYRIEYAWGGNVGFTFDRMPHIGPDQGRRDVRDRLLRDRRRAHDLPRDQGRGVDGRRRGAGAHAASRFPLVPAPYEGRPWFLPVAGRVVPPPGPHRRPVQAQAQAPERTRSRLDAQAARDPALHVPRHDQARRRRASASTRRRSRPSPRSGSSASRPSTSRAVTPSPLAGRSRRPGSRSRARTPGRGSTTSQAFERASAALAELGSSSIIVSGVRVRLRRARRRLRGPAERRRPRSPAGTAWRSAITTTAPRCGPSTASRSTGGCCERVDPAVAFQVDIFWVQVGGARARTGHRGARRTGRVAARQGRRHAAQRRRRRAVRERRRRAGRHRRRGRGRGGRRPAPASAG